ncbi:MAG: adenylyltransferase/cytidyltransferase family protein [Phycisphaerae bacterium]
MTQLPQRKIVPLDQLVQILRRERAAGRTIVQCHGCFDLVHPGHVRYLMFARQLGHVLVVSLTGDATIVKGPDRPYIPQELRAENLAALEFVDWVVIDPHPTACELLQTLRPDVYVKGREYAVNTDPRFAREREIVEAYGGRVVFHSGDVVFSSTRLAQDLARDRHLDTCRLRTLCQRHGIDLHSLRRRLDALRQCPALVVGDVLRERYVLCDPDDAVDESPAPVLNALGERCYWGAAAAAARQFAALGARVTLITAAGADAASQSLSGALEPDGIEAHCLPVRSDMAERCTYVADDARVLQVCRGAALPADSRWERKAIDTACACVPHVRVVLVCDSGLGVVTPAVRRAIAGAARRAGVVLVSCAPSPQGEIGHAESADLLFASERRLRRAMQDKTSSLPAVAWNVLRQTRSRAAIVSLHKRGLISFESRFHPAEPAAAEDSAVHDRLKSDFVPTTAESVIDIAGATEVACAAAGLALAAGSGLAEATYLATAVEAIAAQRPGVAVVSYADLNAWIDGRAELRPESRFMPDSSTLSDLARIALPVDHQPAGAATSPDEEVASSP